MASSGLPPLPPNLKQIQHYLKTAIEHDKRDPVVSYYYAGLLDYSRSHVEEAEVKMKTWFDNVWKGRLYALQYGMEIDKTNPDCRKFHVALMDYLEKTKKENDIEAIHNEVVGQAHMENYALKVFLYADNEDRAARFNKNVVKSFYSAGMLFDTLSVFGEISEDIDKNRKYAKWKAAYIHKCLKNGEMPTPGPMQEEGDEDGALGGGPPIGFEQPGPSGYQPRPSATNSLNLPGNSLSPENPSSGAHAPPSTPQEPRHSQPSPQPSPVQHAASTDWVPPQNAGAAPLGAGEYQRAMKYCKYASSALQYEDSQTAIDNLTKCLKLLTTGKDS